MHGRGAQRGAFAEGSIAGLIRACAFAFAFASMIAARAQSAGALIARVESAQAQDRRPDATEALSLAEAGATLLDVRTTPEWNDGHPRGALLIPWLDVADRAPAVLPDKAAPIVTFCSHGVRASYAAWRLHQLGYTHVLAMSGGFKDLVKAGVAVDSSPAAGPKDAPAPRGPR